MADFAKNIVYLKSNLNLMKMMKRIFLITLGCMMCGMMKAQHQEVFDEFRREAGDQAEMFSGKLEHGYSPTIYINHPYWLSGDFSTGNVMFKGLLYRDVLLRYDAQLKQLIVNLPVKGSNICIPMHLVGKFTLGSTDFERRNGEFVAVLFSSPRMELIEQINITIKSVLENGSKVRYEFERNVKYYVLRGGQMHEVNKLRSVLKLYPEIKRELKRFAKMHYLDFKEHRQSSLNSLIEYADELLTQS